MTIMTQEQAVLKAKTYFEQIAQAVWQVARDIKETN